MSDRMADTAIVGEGLGKVGRGADQGLVAMVPTAVVEAEERLNSPVSLIPRLPLLQPRVQTGSTFLLAESR